MFPKLTILSQLGKKEKHFHFSYDCRFTIFIDKPNFIFQGQDYGQQFCIRTVTAKVNNIKPFDCDMTLALCLLTTSFFIERREVDHGPSKLSWASSRPENWKFKFILKIWFPNSFKIRLYYFNFHNHFPQEMVNKALLTALLFFSQLATKSLWPACPHFWWYAAQIRIINLWLYKVKTKNF